MLQGVERGVDRIDLLEFEQPAVAQPPRLVELATAQQSLENTEGRRPGPHADGRTGFGERLGNGEAEPPVVGDTDDERPFPAQVDTQHGPRVSQIWPPKASAWGRVLEVVVPPV